MKKAIIILTGFFAVASLSAFAQNAQEIVKKHNDAIGGTDKWSKVTSLKKEGTMNMQGMEMPVTMAVLKGKGMRQEFTVMGSSNYIILTPTEGWSFMPVQGQTKAEPLPADQLKDAKDQLDFQDKLMEASEKKYTIELLGKEDIDGKSCFKLKVTDADKDEHTYFVDAATWYMVRAVEKAEMQGQQMEVTINYSNFTKLPSGIVMAMKEDSPNGAITFTKVEENTIKDESIFKP